MSSILRFLALFFLLFLLGSCSLRQLQDLVISPHALEIKGLHQGKVVGEVLLKVNHPGKGRLHFRLDQCRAYLNNRLVGEFTQDEFQMVRGGETVTVPIAVHIDQKAITTGVLSALLGTKATIKLQGKASTKVLFVPVDRSFVRELALDLSQFKF